MADTAGLCLPPVTDIGEAEFGWLDWRQAKQPFSAASGARSNWLFVAYKPAGQWRTLKLLLLWPKPTGQWRTL